MNKLTFLTTLFLSFTLLLSPQMMTDTTLVTSYVANLLFRNNFHEVVPGRFYRSAEMSRQDLAESIKRYGIKSVIDLRLQADEPDSSGSSEAAVSEHHGAAYYHIPLSSSRANQTGQLLKLLEVYRMAQGPILVHCSSGTHRAGIAAAFWLIEREHAPREIAEKQLSVRYGFFQFERYLKSRSQGRPTLDSLLWRYLQAQEKLGVPLQYWLEQEVRATATS